MNRIQNIVVPPRHPLATRLARSLRTQSTSRLRRIYDSILPLDLSSTSSRLALRLPSLYFLCQALVLWAVILMQTAELFPSRAWATELGKWAAKMEMERVCWSTFCAVCGALCTDALTRGLEGAGTSANSSPFNLVGNIHSIVSQADLGNCRLSLDMRSFCTYTRGRRHMSRSSQVWRPDLTSTLSSP